MTTQKKISFTDEAKYLNQTPWDDKRPADSVYKYMISESPVPAFEVQRQVDPKAFRTIHENRLSFGNRVEPEDKWTDPRRGYGSIGPILYKRPELEAADPELPVGILEGEKDTNTAIDLGLVATTNPGGAWAWRWEYRAYFVGRHVWIFEDNDDAGRRRTQWIRRTLRKVAASISVVRFEDMPPGADLSDYIAAGHTLEDVKARVELVDKPIAYSTDTADMADLIEAQLVHAGAGIYQRSDGLYRVITEPGKIGLHRLTTNGLLDHISRHCLFTKMDGKGDKAKCVPAKASKELAELILSRVGLWKFPEINGVSTAPLIRKNGDVVMTRGFDAETGIFLVLPPGEIAVGTSREEAEAALEALKKDLLWEFPIADEGKDSVDLAVLVAGLLTPIARASIDVAPMISIRAHSAGTGKSYYSDCVSMLALGKTIDGIIMPASEEEGEKRLVAAALAGSPIIAIDNCNGTVKGDFLAVLIERPTVKPRILGQSVSPTILNNFTILVNGNNTIFQGDLVRRLILANLDRRMERPETYVFESKPRDIIEQNREKYLGYALTIVSVYLKHVEAGGTRPDLKPFNSFGQWSDIVRAPICWLGMADPCVSVAQVREEDPDLSNIRALFSAWPANEELTVKKLLEKAEYQAKEEAERWSQEQLEGDDMRPANDNKTVVFLKPVLLEIAGDNSRDTINRQTLGQFLRRITGRVVGDQRLNSEHSPAANAKVYSLKKLA